MLCLPCWGSSVGATPRVAPSEMNKTVAAAKAYFLDSFDVDIGLLVVTVS